MGMPVLTVDDLPALTTGLNGVPPASVVELTPEIGAAPEGLWGKVPVRIGFGLLVMVVVGLMTWLITDGLGSATAPPRTAVDGLGIFAVFFVAALAVERLLEPLTMLDRKKPALEETAKDEQKKAVAAIRGLGAGVATAAAAQEQLGVAADAAAATEVWSTYRAVALWGLASILGALAAAMLNLHLLKTAGIQTPSLYLEILATGLIIGAGTKPLHELNKLVTTKTPSTGK